MFFYRSGYIKLQPHIANENMQGNHNYLLIDLRDPIEYQVDHLPNAINVPIIHLPEYIMKINKNTPIYLYCFNGSKSFQAANMLIENGFLYVYDIGGIIYWPFPTVS